MREVYDGLDEGMIKGGFAEVLVFAGSSFDLFFSPSHLQDLILSLA
jgi:hypothetical protein